VVYYVLLIDPVQVSNKQEFDKSKCFKYKYYVLGGEPFHRSSKAIDGGISQ